MRSASYLLCLTTCLAMTACLDSEESTQDDSGTTVLERQNLGASGQPAPTGEQAVECYDQVTICHRPPGNPNRQHTITVGRPAVPAHLAHGDYLGSCLPRICTPGATAPCYSGPYGTKNVGECHGGTKTCNATGTAWSACTGEVVPTSETCDGSDDDCDGTLDEGCLCAPGASESCYDGPAGTEGIGACLAGTRTCDASGMSYGTCTGTVTPAAELCGDAIDNDCDGATDEGCFCTPGETAPCYDGPAGTAGVGACTAGVQTCNAAGTAFGECVGAVLPSPESCADHIDNDCDGVTGESCLCPPGEEWPCYTAPIETDGIGVCQRGIKTCNPDGLSYGACAGEITPSTEVCGDSLDNDCDGETDEGCVCEPDTLDWCYTGPAGTDQVGECARGTWTCNPFGTGFGACLGQVLPVLEACNGVDDNCDGVTDEGCCVPVPEICGDGADNDCDGGVDEGCIGDRAWNDLDRDGLQAAGEPGMVGATFLLRNGSTGALVQVTVSGLTGAYYFSNVPAGSYYIELVTPTGFSPTTMDAGPDHVDTDFDGEVMSTPVFTFDGTTDYTIDCGLAADISG